MSNAASGRSRRLMLLLCLAAAGSAAADTAGTRLRVTATVTQPCSTSLAAAGLHPLSGADGLAVRCSPGKAYAVDVRAARVRAPAADAARHRYQVTPDGRPLALKVSPGTGLPQRYRLTRPSAAGQPAIVTVTF